MDEIISANLHNFDISLTRDFFNTVKQVTALKKVGVANVAQAVNCTSVQRTDGLRAIGLQWA